MKLLNIRLGIRWVIGVAVFGIAALSMIVIGILGLSESEVGNAFGQLHYGEVCEFDVNFAKEILIIDNRDRYYYVEHNGIAAKYLVQAKRSWFNNNFGADGTAKNGLVHISGKAMGYDRDDLAIVNRGFETLPDYTVFNTVYVSMNYKTRYVLHIAAGIVDAAAVVICIVILNKLKLKGSLIAAAALGVATVVSVIALFGGF